jgi:hypothetical protein
MKILSRASDASCLRLVSCVFKRHVELEPHGIGDSRNQSEELMFLSSWSFPKYCYVHDITSQPFERGFEVEARPFLRFMHLDEVWFGMTAMQALTAKLHLSLTKVPRLFGAQVELRSMSSSFNSLKYLHVLLSQTLQHGRPLLLRPGTLRSLDIGRLRDLS